MDKNAHHQPSTSDNAHTANTRLRCKLQMETESDDIFDKEKNITIRTKWRGFTKGIDDWENMRNLLTQVSTESDASKPVDTYGFGLDAKSDYKPRLCLPINLDKYKETLVQMNTKFLYFLRTKKTSLANRQGFPPILLRCGLFVDPPNSQSQIPHADIDATRAFTQTTKQHSLKMWNFFVPVTTPSKSVETRFEPVERYRTHDFNKDTGIEDAIGFDAMISHAGAGNNTKDDRKLLMFTYASISFFSEERPCFELSDQFNFRKPLVDPSTICYKTLLSFHPQVLSNINLYRWTEYTPDDPLNNNNNNKANKKKGTSLKSR